MAAVVHCNPDSAPAGEKSLHTGIANATEWHGLYGNLLFQRGPDNPPCNHLRSTDEQTVRCHEKEAGYDCVASSSQDIDTIATNAAFVQDFLSSSPQARRRNAQLRHFGCGKCSEARLIAECTMFSLAWKTVLQMRARGCSNVPSIIQALGNAANEFILFLRGEILRETPFSVARNMRCCIRSHNGIMVSCDGRGNCLA